MSKRDLYIIAGCNGAGKTTASFTILLLIEKQSTFESLKNYHDNS